MTTLKKTLDLLPRLNEEEINQVYSYVSFLLNKPEDINFNNKLEILNNLRGIIKDSGKSLDDYRKERLEERYDLNA